MATTKERLARAQTRIKTIAQEGAQAIEGVKGLAVAGVVGAGLGYAKGMEYEEVGGVPLSAAVALGSLALTFVPGTKMVRNELLSSGQAASAIYFYKYGEEMALESDSSSGAAHRRSQRRRGALGAGLGAGLGSQARARASAAG